MAAAPLLAWQEFMDQVILTGVARLGWADLRAEQFFKAIVAVEGLLRHHDNQYRNQAYVVDDITRRYIPSFPADKPERRAERLLVIWRRQRDWPAYVNSGFGQSQQPCLREIEAILRPGTWPTCGTVTSAVVEALPSPLREAFPGAVDVPARHLFLRREVERLVRQYEELLLWPAPERRKKAKQPKPPGLSPGERTEKRRAAARKGNETAFARAHSHPARLAPFGLQDLGYVEAQEERPGFTLPPANFRPDPVGLARASAWVDAHMHELRGLGSKASQRRLSAAAWDLLNQDSSQGVSQIDAINAASGDFAQNSGVAQGIGNDLGAAMRGVQGARNHAVGDGGAPEQEG